jgi:GTPase SAR1 family protein
MIVIEGMDNSGKSTLARYLAENMKTEIQESEGPPQSRTEINDRIRRYQKAKNTIFVRHPCVSNIIYDITRPPEERNLIDEALIDEFYDSDPTFIYCDPQERRMQGHLVKEHDSVEHLDRVHRYYPMLLSYYREWAINYAHIIYRIRDGRFRIWRWLDECQ